MNTTTERESANVGPAVISDMYEVMTAIFTKVRRAVKLAEPKHVWSVADMLPTFDRSWTTGDDYTFRCSNVAFLWNRWQFIDKAK